MVGFAALYKTHHPLNPYYKNEEILLLASSTLAFWADTCQHANGSFDEWYKNEHSYCPTAITSAGAALTMHLLSDDLPKEIMASGRRALANSAGWLAKRYNKSVMNQNLAAAVALRGAAKLLGDDQWQKHASGFMTRIGRDQNSEGWFPEYNGADFGYSTLALDFLAAYQVLGEDSAVFEMAHKLSAFLLRVQGNTGSLPGRLGSRGTSHTFTFGALYFSQHHSEAAALTQVWLSAIRDGHSPRPTDVDDRYFSYFYFPQFALAFLQTANTVAQSNKPVATKGFELPKSGFVGIRTNRANTLIAQRLGGAFAIEKHDLGYVYHLGYEAVLTNGERFSTAVWDSKKTIGSMLPYDDIRTITAFQKVSTSVPLKRLMIPFQIATALFRFSWIAEPFQAFVKDMMVSPKMKAPLQLERLFSIKDDVIHVTDRFIPGKDLKSLCKLQIAKTISMHSPSARQENAVTFNLDITFASQLVAGINKGEATEVTYSIRTTGELRDFTISKDSHGHADTR